MSLSWTKWICSLVAVLVLAAACQFYAQLYLVDLGAFIDIFRGTDIDPTQMLRPQEHKIRPVYERTIDALEYTVYLPWPVVGEFGRKGRPLDPAHLQDCDAAATLALMAPDDSLGWEYSHWFKSLIELALKRTESSQQQRKFEQFALYAESKTNANALFSYPRSLSHMLSPDMNTESNQLEMAAALEFEEQIQERAARLDPENAYYYHRRTYHELLKLIEAKKEDTYTISPLASVDRADEFHAIKKDRMLPAARQIDEWLTHVETHCTLNFYRDISWGLHSAAVAYRWGSTHPEGLMSNLQPPLVLLGGMYRQETKRLCFLGDQLKAAGYSALALRMYRHAHHLSKQLMNTKNKGVSSIQYLVGIACADLTKAHLMEFWADRGDAHNVMAINRYTSYLNRIFRRLGDHLRQSHADPYGANDQAFIAYLRISFLTWWLSLTAAMFFLCSLIIGVFYYWFDCPRLSALAVSRMSYRSVACMVAVPILLIAWLAVLFPSPLIPLEAARPTLPWALLLSGCWVVAICLLTHPVARMDWIWAVTSVCALIGGLLATIRADNPAPAVAVIAVAVFLAGLILWLLNVIIIVYWRTTESVRISRAHANRSFAATTMMAAVGCLTIALATMPLVRQLQIEYFQATAEHERSGTKQLMDNDWWPTPSRGLPSDLFELDENASSQG